MGEIARWLIGAGVLLVVIGLIALGLSRFGISRLPGDFVWQRGNFTVFAPIGTMVVLSLVLTVVVNLLQRWR